MAKKKQSPEEEFARRFEVLLDLPGILYAEASNRITKGEKLVKRLERELKRHKHRISAAMRADGAKEASDAWVEAIQGVGGLEATFGATVKEFVVADVLLVAAAEAYVNAVASHVISAAEYDQFDKLSPIGKWLFLPKVMKIKWRLHLDEGCLQQFSTVVRRRNRVIHPRTIKVKNLTEVETFLKHLSLDSNEAKRGLTAVRDLIRGVSLSWRGSSGPNWLDAENALAHPPCFLAGNVEVPMRFGRPGER